MPLKKQTFNADKIEIYDEAVVYKRGEYWQMRMWLGKEKKYARFSLRPAVIKRLLSWFRLCDKNIVFNVPTKSIFVCPICKHIQRWVS
jgi:hypothetical protein